MFFKRKDPIEVALRENLDGDFVTAACGKDAPKEAIIQAFETTLGYSLPQDFRKFSMSPYGGIYIEAKETVWPKAKQFEVASFWSFLRGLMVFGFASDVPEALDIRKQTAKFQAESGTKLAPFMKIMADPDVYCFDEHGAVRKWDHETDEPELIEKSFETVFIEELAELRKRKEKKKAAKD